MVKRTACCLLIAVQLSACATLQAVDLAGPPGEAVHKGDNLLMTRRDGTEKRFVVSSISPKSVCGFDECVDFDDIVRVQRYERDNAAMAGLAVLSLVGIGAIVSAVSHAALSVGAAYLARGL